MKTYYFASKELVVAGGITALTAVAISFAAGVYAGWQAHKEVMKDQEDRSQAPEELTTKNPAN
jgi:hypothetical protein